MANTSIYNAFDRMWQHTIAAIGEKAGNKVYVQADEPTDAQAGELWYDTDDGSELPNINDINIDASSIASGQVPVEHGGTGASTATEARENLGAAPAVYEYDAVNGDVCNTYVTDTKIFVMNGVIGSNAISHGFLDVKRYHGYGFVPAAGLGVTNPVVHQKFTEYQNSWTAHRWSIDGGVSWSEWEFDNPPMVAGVEYRTTERCNGRTIFKKLVSYNITSQVGNNSTTTTLAVPHDITGFGQAIRVEAWKGNYIFPMLAASGGTTNITTVDATNINFRMRNDYVGAGNMYISLSYIKSGVY